MSRPPNRSPQTLLVLEVLLGARRAWRHGYDLAKETGLQSGTLYPILMRLAEQGLLEESWQPADVAGRPPRHLYRLTTAGVATARELVRREPATRGALRVSRASSR
jgi:DNA-binding PadR family transcriptional regulator